MNKSTCDLLIRNGQVITMDSERRIYRQRADIVVKSPRARSGSA